MASGQPLKVHMHAESRKAPHTNRAHHQANLVFSRPLRASGRPFPSVVLETPEVNEAARERVRAGLLGFVSVRTAVSGREPFPC